MSNTTDLAFERAMKAQNEWFAKNIQPNSFFSQQQLPQQQQSNVVNTTTITEESCQKTIDSWTAYGEYQQTAEGKAERRKSRGMIA